jgi:splicing factor 3B subunit 3
MIGAVEKQKLVYVLNRDAHAKLTISSPLEAHKSHTITFAYAGLDVGFENPVFAALEVDYGDIDQDVTGEALRNVQKHLTYYELDLGLNHVVRKLSDAVDNSAHLLITGTFPLSLQISMPWFISPFSVPGGTEGPGGLLVCCQNWLLYRNQGQPELKVRIPRREGYPADQNLMIVSYATHKQKVCAPA